MESPFYKENSSIVLYLEPILNTYYKMYQNVITLSAMPDGPLADLVTSVSVSKLSRFQEAGLGMYTSNCAFVLLRYPKNMGSLKCADYFMSADDIPAVFSYLQNHGYTIDTNLTKMLYKSPVTIGGVSEKRISGNRKMICMVQYSKK